MSDSPSAAPSPPPPPSGHSRQRRKEARPQELLDAALELFIEKGFAATRSEEVAVRAGVSKGTLYLYFPSKEDLFKAVVRQNLSALIAASQQIVDAYDGPTPELLRLLVREYWDHVSISRVGGICKIILAEVRNFPELAQFYVDEVIEPAHRLLAAALQRGMDRGEFRPVPLRPAVLALLAPSIFMAMQRHSIGACPLTSPCLIDEGEVIETQLDLMLDGLNLRGPTPGTATIQTGTP
jgi:AcrR family transcriptional regulator